MEFDYQIIEEKFKSLPQSMQMAMNSEKVLGDVRAIGDKYGLMIDQQGTLFDVVSFTMLGLVPANQFVSTLARETGLQKQKCQEIADEINRNVFTVLREEMRKLGEKNTALDQDSTLSSIGGIEIEHPEDRNAPSDAEQNIENRPEILSSIENPEPAPKTYVPSSKIGTDPLIDHLLTTPVVIPPQKIIKPSGPDPYRELPN